MADIKDELKKLQQNGFVLIEGALSPDETERIRQRINYAREQGWEEGLNAVGNMWFDTLLGSGTRYIPVACRAFECPSLP